MARPKKEGLDYFPFDVDFFSDRKIKILKARFGADGITIYIYLLCEVYKKGFSLILDEDFLYIVADDLSMSEDKVKQVLNFLLERSLLDSKLFQSDKVLTSAGIQRRYQEAVRTRASKTPIEIEDFWLLDEKETETFIKVRHKTGKSENNHSYSEKNSDKSEIYATKKSKVKESKEKGEKEGVGRYFDNEELDNTFRLFLTYRERKYSETLDSETVRLMKEELNSLSDKDEVKVAVIKKSITKGWKNLYPDDEKKKPEKKKPKNGFNNIEQRDYDYDSLEGQILG